MDNPPTGVPAGHSPDPTPAPDSARSAAALYITLVLLVGGFGIVFVLLLRPPPVGAMDAALATALIAGIGGLLSAITLVLRYWFPPNKE